MPKKLSNAELYYISANPQGKTAKELGKELGFHENVIKKYMTVNNSVNDEEIILPQPKPKVIPLGKNADEKMGKKVRNGQIVGTVMTPGASEVSDDARKERGAAPLKESLRGAIHKPKSPSNTLSSEETIEFLKEEIKRLKRGGRPV